MNRNFDLAFEYYKKYESKLKTKPSKFQKNKLISCFYHILDESRNKYKWKIIIEELSSLWVEIEWMICYVDYLSNDKLRLSTLLDSEDSEIKYVIKWFFERTKKEILEKKAIKSPNRYAMGYIYKQDTQWIKWLWKICWFFRKYRTKDYIIQVINKNFHEAIFDYFLESIEKLFEEKSTFVLWKVHEKDNFFLGEDGEVIITLNIDRANPKLKINKDWIFITNYLWPEDYKLVLSDKKRLPLITEIEEHVKSFDISQLDWLSLEAFIQNFLRKEINFRIYEIDDNIDFRFMWIFIEYNILQISLLAKILDYYNPKWVFDGFFENTNRDFKDKETAQLFEILKKFLENNPPENWYKFLYLLPKISQSILNSKSELLHFMKSFGDEKNILDLKKMEYYLS